MALISCPECGNKCSDTADFCPKCGYVFKRGTASGSDGSTNNSSPTYENGHVVDYETKVVFFWAIPTVKHGLSHNDELKALYKEGWEVYSVDKPSESAIRYMARLRRRRPKNETTTKANDDEVFITCPKCGRSYPLSKGNYCPYCGTDCTTEPTKKK